MRPHPFEKLLQLYPEDQVGNNNLGEIYRNIEEWDEAIDIVTKEVVYKTPGGVDVPRKNIN